MNPSNAFALVAILILLGFTHFIAYSTGYENAVSRQEKANEKVEEKVSDKTEEIVSVDQEYKEEKQVIKNEAELKYTQIEAEQQYMYGVLEGRKREREDMRKEGFSEDHSCLAIPYSDDDGVLKSAKSLQREVMGVSKNP